jgi:hypothetical protein
LEIVHVVSPECKIMQQVDGIGPMHGMDELKILTVASDQ